MKTSKKILMLLLCTMVIGLYGCKEKNNEAVYNNQEIKKETSQKSKEEKNTSNNNSKDLKKDTEDTAKKNIKNHENNEEAFPQNIPLKHNNEDICILMYHSIDYEKNNNLRMPKEKFSEQMKYIKDNGYTTLTVSQLHDFIEKDSPIPKKSVVITLDDGYADNYTNAYPILKKYGINATIFVITDSIDKDNSYLNSKQIKELQNNGIDIQSHTTNHQELHRLPYEKQLQTLKDSKEVLENLLNKKITCIAYPCGKYNNDTIRAAKEAGYTMALATGGRLGKKSDGIYGIKRIGVYADNGMNIVRAYLK